MEKLENLNGLELAVWNDWELGFDTVDIAERLGTNEATVVRALHAARRKMAAVRSLQKIHA